MRHLYYFNLKVLPYNMLKGSYSCNYLLIAPIGTIIIAHKTLKQRVT